MRRTSLIVAAASSLVLIGGGMSGCAQLTGAAGDIAQGTSTAQPQDANDLASAERLAKFTFTAMDAYISTAHPSLDQLNTVDVYRQQIVTELNKLRAAHTRGQSLTLTAFNDALHAWLSWKAQHGSP